MLACVNEDEDFRHVRHTRAVPMFSRTVSTYGLRLWTVQRRFDILSEQGLHLWWCQTTSFTPPLLTASEPTTIETRGHCAHAVFFSLPPLAHARGTPPWMRPPVDAFLSRSTHRWHYLQKVVRCRWAGVEPWCGGGPDFRCAVGALLHCLAHSRRRRVPVFPRTGEGGAQSFRVLPYFLNCLV